MCIYAYTIITDISTQVREVSAQVGNQNVMTDRFTHYDSHDPTCSTLYMYFTVTTLALALILLSSSCIVIPKGYMLVP